MEKVSLWGLLFNIRRPCWLSLHQTKVASQTGGNRKREGGREIERGEDKKGWREEERTDPGR